MCGFFSNVTGHLTNREFLLGMLLATLLLVIVFLVVKLICRCRRNCNRIVLQDQGGNFVIYRTAFRNFLKGVLKGVPGLVLRDVRLRQLKEGKLAVNLLLGAEPGADVVKIHDTLRLGILKEISEKLGISYQIGEMNLLFSSLPPSDELKGEPGREITPISPDDEV